MIERNPVEVISRISIWVKKRIEELDKSVLRAISFVHNVQERELIGIARRIFDNHRPRLDGAAASAISAIPDIDLTDSKRIIEEITQQSSLDPVQEVIAAIESISRFDVVGASALLKNVDTIVKEHHADPRASRLRYTISSAANKIQWDALTKARSIAVPSIEIQGSSEE